MSREPIATLVPVQNNSSALCNANFSAPRLPRTRKRWHRIESGQPTELSRQNDCTKTKPWARASSAQKKDIDQTMAIAPRSCVPSLGAAPTMSPTRTATA